MDCSNPVGKIFKPKNLWTILAHIKPDSTKVPINAFKNKIFITSIFIESNPMWARTVH